RAAPAIAYTICAAALLLFFLLLLPAFFRMNLAAWSIGIAYIAYDTGLLIFTAVQIARLRPAPVASTLASTLGTSRPRLAVIMAAHNEAEVLEVTIAHLLAQSDPPDEIVIADDGSTDATPERLFAHYGLSPPAMGEMSAPAPGARSLRWLRLPHG